MGKWTEEDVAQILVERKEGKTLGELAAKYQASNATIHNIINGRYDATKQNRHTQKTQQIIEELKNGVSINALVDKYGISKQRISAIKAMGQVPKSNRYYTKYSKIEKDLLQDFFINGLGVMQLIEKYNGSDSAIRRRLVFSTGLPSRCFAQILVSSASPRSRAVLEALKTHTNREVAEMFNITVQKVAAIKSREKRFITKHRADVELLNKKKQELLNNGTIFLN